PLVVHDLVTDIDGRTIFLERQLDDLHGALNPGAESPGLRENHQHAAPTFPLTVANCSPLQPACRRYARVSEQTRNGSIPSQYHTLPRAANITHVVREPG